MNGYITPANAIGQYEYMGVHQNGYNYWRRIAGGDTFLLWFNYDEYRWELTNTVATWRSADVFSDQTPVGYPFPPVANATGTAYVTETEQPPPSSSSSSAP